jgi:ribonuclease P protein component
MTVHVLANDFGKWRVGLVVPRLGHSAVQRNLLKRRLREIARLELLPRQGSYDVVIRVSGPAYDLNYWGLRAAVLAALERLSLR